MSTRLIMFFISILSLIFIVSLSRSIYSLWNKDDLITQREEVLKKRQEENQELKAKLVQIQSQEFIEKEAREKLNLTREGEVVVVLPKDIAVEAAQVPEMASIPSWKQWYDIFF